MACRLSGVKQLSESVLGYYQQEAEEQTSVKWQNTKLFIHKNISENIVCKMEAIFQEVIR